jgi:hypothetical protein
VKRRDDDPGARCRPTRCAGAWLAVAALLACGAPSARAAEDEPAAPGPPLVTREVPPVVVRAVEPADLPEDPSSFTTLIDVDAYRGEVTSVEDLLERTPGVQIRRFGGEGQPAEISIRGSTARRWTCSSTADAEQRAVGRGRSVDASRRSRTHRGVARGRIGAGWQRRDRRRG